jgi:predicted transcriptional regulator
MKKTQKSQQNLEKQKIQKILEYFVAEGIAYEVSPGQYMLTEEGKKMSK